MADWFYTDANATQQGPVDGSTLLGLNREGAITARSLVWREGMGEWVAFREIAASLFEPDEEGLAPKIGVCAHSGRVHLLRELLPYGEALVSPESKDEFVRRLMEGAEVEIADATERRDEFVGFWWRSLSSLLDYMIKMVPASLCMVPYYIAAVTSGAESGGDDTLAGLTGGSAIVIVAYGFGLLGVLALSIFYETWMTGKYQATLGKIIIGAKVVNPDGSRLTYKRAFVRWLAKKPLNYLLVWGPSTLGFGIVVALVVAAEQRGGDSGAALVLAMMTGLFVYGALLLLCSGVYWMAAFDPEKRALHDRVASTRVVKK